MYQNGQDGEAMSLIDDILNSVNNDKPDWEGCIDWWRKQKLSTVDDYLNVLKDFRIVFTQCSNAIENIYVNYITTKNIFNNEPILNVEDMDDFILINNQVCLFNEIIDDILSGNKLSIESIKHYHYILLCACYDRERVSKGELPGQFKKRDYCVGLIGISTPPDEVESEMQELLDEIHSVDCIPYENVIKIAAYFHMHFETMHPFADGNGRLGRMLLNYILMYYGLPPIVIFDNDKDTYYLALEVFDRTGELSGFVQFLKEQMVKTWYTNL